MSVRKKSRLHETFKFCNWKGQTLKPEDTVQISSGDFIFIKSILQEHSIVLSGLLLRRNSDFEMRVAKKPNKVYFIHNPKVVRGEVLRSFAEDVSLETYCERERVGEDQQDLVTKILQ
jgi:DNA (cytosine-5)-methyltransferase 1